MSDYPPNLEFKAGFELIFNENFDQQKLSAERWFPFYLPQWNSREASMASYRFQANQLILQITENQQPWCPEFNGEVKVSNLQTGVCSGPRGSTMGQHQFSNNLVVREAQESCQLFTQQYGYFEIRAKGTADPNNVFGFWMIGFEDRPERSAEICPFELKGWNVKSEASVIGFGLHPFGDPDIEDEFFEREFAIDPTEFHIYAVNWQPDSVEFYIDNKLIHRSEQSPDYPMQLMLNIYEIPPAESGSKQAPDYPAEFTVDYVRCYRCLEINEG